REPVLLVPTLRLGETQQDVALAPVAALGEVAVDVALRALGGEVAPPPADLGGSRRGHRFILPSAYELRGAESVRSRRGRGLAASDPPPRQPSELCRKRRKTRACRRSGPCHNGHDAATLLHFRHKAAGAGGDGGRGRQAPGCADAAVSSRGSAGPSGPRRT